MAFADGSRPVVLDASLPSHPASLFPVLLSGCLTVWLSGCLMGWVSKPLSAAADAIRPGLSRCCPRSGESLNRECRVPEGAAEEASSSGNHSTREGWKSARNRNRFFACQTRLNERNFAQKRDKDSIFNNSSL
jgi:hypothetical protein